MLALAVAAQDVWWGLSRRLIPRRGVTVVRPPGVLGARRKLSPVVWALIVRTRLSSGCLGFCGCEQVVGATGDLARDGEPRAAAATARSRAHVQGMVGTRLSAAVVGGFYEHPAQVTRSLPGESIAAFAVCGLEHGRVETARANKLT